MAATTDAPRRSLARLAVVLGVAAALASGCGAAESANGGEGRLPAPVSTSSAAAGREVFARLVAGGTADQRELLGEILATLREPLVATVEIGPVPEGFTTPAEHADAVWVSYEVGAGDRAESVRATWQANLVTGAFRARSLERGLPFVLGKSIVIRFSDGTLEDAGMALVEPPATDGPISAGQQAELGRLIQSAVARSGARLQSLSFSKPYHLAVEVHVTVNDPAQFVRRIDERIHTIFGGLEDAAQPRVEGAYLEARDSTGASFYARGYAVRVAEGVGWIRPDFEGLTSS